MMRSYLLEIIIAIFTLNIAYSQSQGGYNSTLGARHNYSSLYSYGALTQDSTLRTDSVVTGKGSVVLRVVGETAIGGLMGVFCALPGGVIGGTLSGEKGLGALGPGLFGMYVGYTFGSSYGVYLIGKNYKQEVSFWGTFASSVVGAGIGIWINQRSGQKWVGSLAPLILPVAASIIYVELN